MRCDGLALGWVCDARVQIAHRVSLKETSLAVYDAPFPAGQKRPVCMESRCIRGNSGQADFELFLGQLHRSASFPRGLTATCASVNGAARGMVSRRMKELPGYVVLTFLYSSHTSLPKALWFLTLAYSVSRILCLRTLSRTLFIRCL